MHVVIFTGRFHQILAPVLLYPLSFSALSPCQVMIKLIESGSPVESHLKHPQKAFRENERKDWETVSALVFVLLRAGGKRENLSFQRKKRFLEKAFLT